MPVFLSSLITNLRAYVELHLKKKKQKKMLMKLNVLALMTAVFDRHSMGCARGFFCLLSS